MNVKPNASLHRCASAVLVLVLGIFCSFACGDDGGKKQASNQTPSNAPRKDAAVVDRASNKDAATSTADAATRDASKTIDAGDAARPFDGGDAGGAVTTPRLGLPSSCRNSLRDGNETDIDCGGTECGTCLSGRKCGQGTDCLSGECADGNCTCLPLTKCPVDACGSVRHCGGELDCGACTSGVCYENRCCEPRTCGDGECGVFADGCGGAIRCGDDSCCTPRTCEHPSLDNRCGAYDDRCGGSVSCVCADSAARCYIGECCVPSACSTLGRCGAGVSDGCGGVQSCSCGSGEVCKAGVCCQPLDCSAWVGPGCGELDDGCGGTVSCGCTAGESCRAGACCTPKACGTGVSGDACGNAVSDGCGATQSCGCLSGLSCYMNQCCGAQDCAAQGLDDRCGAATDGCGLSQWCGCGQTSSIRVAQRAACGAACADTLSKVNACTATAPLEVLDQTAGWDFSASLSADLCNASYGFSPNWGVCHNNFQLDAQGFIYLTAGMHCFSITGSTGNACGALYFVASPSGFAGWDALPGSTAATVVTGNAPVCFNLAVTDYYPIRWHYTQNAWLQNFHVNHCPGGTGGCAPLSSALLRPALP